MEKHPPLRPIVEAIEKGAFGSPSTKVANFTCKYIWSAVIWELSIVQDGII